jgi:hypothetical protein
MNIRTGIRLAALTGVLSVSILGAVAQPRTEGFTWRDSAGRPAMGDHAGIYIWHEGKTVYVATESEHRKNTGIRATLRNGRIDNVSRIHDERGDTIIQPRNNEVEFKSRTWDGRDEMRFDVDGGGQLVIDVRQPHERNRPIFVGGGDLRVDGNRVVLYTHDRR